MGAGASSGANTPLTPSQPLGRGGLVAVGAIFASSGAAALVYQVSWQRILALHSGVGVYSVAVIVAAFLAGLGVGSYAGGRISTRLGSRAALRVFALLELGIAALAALTPFVYYDLLYLRWPELFASALRAAPLHFALLLPPTLLMGMSLPFLARAAVSDPGSAPRIVGYLYGINVLGAAVGAMATPWVLMRLAGVRGAILCGVMLNTLSGIGALGLTFAAWQGTARTRLERTRTEPSSEPAGDRPLTLWVALYALSGFVALSLEILWFRVVDVAVRSTAFTFGTVLAGYLFGLGVGSLAGAPFGASLARPLRTFLLCQCLVLLFAAAALNAVVWVPAGVPGFDALLSFWRRYEEFPLGSGGGWGSGAGLYIAIPMFLFGVPTFLMGLSFCVLQRAVQDDVATTGLKVGILQAANIVGNVAGSLVTGLLLLEVAGTPGTMRVLLTVGVLFPVVGILAYGWRSSFPALGALLLITAFVVPTQDRFWLRLHGLTAGPALFAEDASGLTSVTPETDGSLRVSINGKGQSSIPFGGLHSLLGAAPAAIHPAPRDIAIIGLGSGDTAWAAAFRGETESVRVFEISAGQRGLLEAVIESAPYPELVRFLDDPRVRVTVADGRASLAASDARYDIIEADALRPGSAYSGNLYSVEFFRLCADRLRPGGLMCTWAPTARVYVSFCEAFPHVVEMMSGAILVGSNEPIPVDLETWADRLSSERAFSYLGPELGEGLITAMRSARPAALELYTPALPNRDLFPRDEFAVPGPP